MEVEMVEASDSVLAEETLVVLRRLRRSRLVGLSLLMLVVPFYFYIARL